MTITVMISSADGFLMARADREIAAQGVPRLPLTPEVTALRWAEQLAISVEKAQRKGVEVE